MLVERKNSELGKPRQKPNQTKPNQMCGKVGSCTSVRSFILSKHAYISIIVLICTCIQHTLLSIKCEKSGMIIHKRMLNMESVALNGQTNVLNIK